MISVVIPALNEAARMPGLLHALRAEPVSLEVIVVDGDSADGTAEAARAAGATLVLSAPRGRGQALTAGAEAARGDAVVPACGLRLPAWWPRRPRTAAAGAAGGGRRQLPPPLRRQ